MIGIPEYISGILLKNSKVCVKEIEITSRYVVLLLAEMYQVGSVWGAPCPVI